MVVMWSSWVWRWEGESGVRGGQRFIASVDRELQFPDSSSNSFYITWAVSSQGLKNLAIYGNNYGTESSRQRRRKREKIGGGV